MGKVVKALGWQYPVPLELLSWVVTFYSSFQADLLYAILKTALWEMVTTKNCLSYIQRKARSIWNRKLSNPTLNVQQGFDLHVRTRWTSGCDQMAYSVHHCISVLVAATQVLINRVRTRNITIGFVFVLANDSWNWRLMINILRSSVFTVRDTQSFSVPVDE